MSKLDENRPVQPEVEIAANPFFDERKAIVDYMDKKYADFKHAWQRGNIEAFELERKSQEVVKENGKEIKHGGDILVRIPKTVYEANKRRLQEQSRLQASRAFKNPDDIVKVASPKVPKKLEN